MFTRQRTLDTARGASCLGTTISREARRDYHLSSVWASCAEGGVQCAGIRFVVGGAYDRSAIMRAALAAARRRQGVNGAPWSVCLADALRGVWKVARAQRGTTKH